MNVNNIIAAKRAQLTERGLLPRLQQSALPSSITNARPSLRSVRQATPFVENRPAVASTPFSLFFDIALPAIQASLLDAGEQRFRSVLDSLCEHGQKMMEEHGEAANGHLLKLFGELPLHKDLLISGLGSSLIEAYKKISFENCYDDYYWYVRPDPIGVINRKGGHIVGISVIPSATENDLVFLCHLPYLNSLDLSRCKKITGEWHEHLVSPSILHTLNLKGCEQITDGDLEHVASFTSLKSLNLDDCKNITDEGIRHLSSLTSLKSLILRGCRHITDEGLRSLSSLTSIQSLDLAFCNSVTDEGLQLLSSLADLHSLNLHFSIQITDNGLRSLSSLPFLHSLFLSFCNRITDDGLRHLSSFASLKHLDLERVCRSDEGLMQLSSLTELESLNLQGCENITDAGLLRLGSLKNLKHLNLIGCLKITVEGWEKLNSLIPNACIIMT